MSGRSDRNSRVAGVISIEGSAVESTWRAGGRGRSLGLDPLPQLPRLLTSLSALVPTACSTQDSVGFAIFHHGP